MKPVIVDTVTWSHILRRPAPNAQINIAVQQLVTEGRLIMLGAIRQELLSGIRHTAQFDKLKRRLRAYPDVHPTTLDYEHAAHFSNLCRRNGIQGSNVDYLICAVAANRDFLIFTSDKDFVEYQKHLPIQLFDLNSAG